ncbi:MAG: hybrid sensor histidine kinase/response regulator [Burkholderiales bacterium]|nr:MAG: hybrid sensor histidine kinase/response regulator [Burkholderiales bacterium]
MKLAWRQRLAHWAAMSPDLSVRNAQIGLVQANSSISVLGAWVCGVIMTAAMWPYVSHTFSLAWIAALTLLCIYSQAISIGWRWHTPRTWRQWLGLERVHTRRTNRVMHVMACMSLLWGLWCWQGLTAASIQKASTPMLIVALSASGMSAGGMAYAAAYFPAAAMYLLVVLLPVIWAAAIAQSDMAQSLWQGALTLLCALLFFARTISLRLRTGIELQFKNELLVQQLAEESRQAHLAREQAEEANRAKTRFLAAASHDLRQPAQALNLFVQLLANSQPTEQQQTLIEHIRKACHANSEMLNALLDYSRIEAGVLVAQPSAVPVAALLHQLEEEFGAQADQRQLVYRTRDSDLRIHADATMAMLILRNFVSNALRYTATGGILVCARQRGQEVRIQVCDTGLGIPLEQQQAVFKEFHQLGNPERDKQKGLGLGLAIAKGLAQSMGATIQLRSRVGHGSVFTLCLPLSREAISEDDYVLRSGGWMAAQLARPPAFAQGMAPESQSSQASSEQLLQGLRILVVDDEAALRISMQALLQSWGCEVRTAEGWQEALALCEGLDLHAELAFKNKGFVPDLLITDYRLREGVSGAEVIIALRKALGQALPVIIITGDTDPSRIREASLQAATLLHKPVGVLALRDAILALCHSTAE